MRLKLFLAGKERLHEGGTVWKGDSERPVWGAWRWFWGSVESQVLCLLRR